MKTLIIIDMQNDFMPWGSLPVPHADQIIKKINEAMNKFEHVVATKDWHPPDHVSFALNHGKQPGERIEVEGKEQILWPVHCVQDSLGADLVAPLDKTKIEKVFEKGTDPEVDSYSAFFDAKRRKASDLDAFLKKVGAKDLYFVGVATEYCVKSTIDDALSLGYNAFLITDLTQAVNQNPQDGEMAYRALKDQGAKIISSEGL